jgi:NAD(P)-dependent dehydrogenase (short-subunit alcohol dehydrogenase family)
MPASVSSPHAGQVRTAPRLPTDTLSAMSAQTRGAVVVTGSSTGIGRACALALAEAGFHVFAGVRKPEDGEALASAASGELEPLALDVIDGDSIAAAAERVREATGGRLAGLVNNAGVVVPGPVEGVELDELRRQLEVNVVGQVAVSQAFLPMIRAARGRVVLMSSIGGRMSLPYLSPYNASKYALEAIGDSLRQEMRQFGVEVAIIEPGSVATPFWDKGLAEAPKARAALDPELGRIYAEELDRVEAASAKTAARGVPPERVADAVLEALTAKRPKTRYVVGTDAKIQAQIRRLLPDRLIDRLIARELS